MKILKIIPIGCMPWVFIIFIIASTCSSCTIFKKSKSSSHKKEDTTAVSKVNTTKISETKSESVKATQEESASDFQFFFAKEDSSEDNVGDVVLEQENQKQKAEDLAGKQKKRSSSKEHKININGTEILTSQRLDSLKIRWKGESTFIEYAADDVYDSSLTMSVDSFKKLIDEKITTKEKSSKGLPAWLWIGGVTIIFGFIIWLIYFGGWTKILLWFRKRKDGRTSE